MSKDAPLLFAVLLLVWTNIASAQPPQYETDNFVICNASNVSAAKEFGDAAEAYRQSLALLWLGKELPNWTKKCPVKIHEGQLGAGGSTTFVFDNGTVGEWDMEVQGTKQRILDSVLPHEITHTVFATHFRKPIPRWLDEGAASSVENDAEKNKYRKLLLTFLDSRDPKCLPFNSLVSIKEYPGDPMPFYAQGLSIAEYLLVLGKQYDTNEHQRLVRFIGSVMTGSGWETALNEHYDVSNLGALQTQWVAWVTRNGQTVRLTYGKSVYDRTVAEIPVSFEQGTVLR